jgi:hypothetical protein
MAIEDHGVRSTRLVTSLAVLLLLIAPLVTSLYMVQMLGSWSMLAAM